MQMLERQQKLSGIESTSLFVETLFSLEMMEELSAIDEPVHTQSTKYLEN
jgi:hypothetical protein